MTIMTRKTPAQLDREISVALATPVERDGMWTVTYKLDKGPLIKTGIMAATSDAAWMAFAAYRIEHGVSDYHTAQVFQESE